MNQSITLWVDPRLNHSCKMSIFSGLDLVYMKKCYYILDKLVPSLNQSNLYKDKIDLS